MFAPRQRPRTTTATATAAAAAATVASISSTGAQPKPKPKPKPMPNPTTKPIPKPTLNSKRPTTAKASDAGTSRPATTLPEPAASAPTASKRTLRADPSRPLKSLAATAGSLVWRTHPSTSAAPPVQTSAGSTKQRQSKPAPTVRANDPSKSLQQPASVSMVPIVRTKAPSAATAKPAPHFAAMRKHWESRQTNGTLLKPALPAVATVAAAATAAAAAEPSSTVESGQQEHSSAASSSIRPAASVNYTPQTEPIDDGVDEVFNNELLDDILTSTTATDLDQTLASKDRFGPLIRRTTLMHRQSDALALKRTSLFLAPGRVTKKVAKATIGTISSRVAPAQSIQSVYGAQVHEYNQNDQRWPPEKDESASQGQGLRLLRITGQPMRAPAAPRAMPMTALAAATNQLGQILPFTPRGKMGSSLRGNFAEAIREAASPAHLVNAVMTAHRTGVSSQTHSSGLTSSVLSSRHTYETDASVFESPKSIYPGKVPAATTPAMTRSRTLLPNPFDVLGITPSNAQSDATDSLALKAATSAPATAPATAPAPAPASSTASVDKSMSVEEIRQELEILIKMERQLELEIMAYERK